LSCPLEGGPVHAGQSDGRTARAIAGRGSGQALTRLDGFRPTDTDQEEQKRTWNQSAGEFLIDRGGSRLSPGTSSRGSPRPSGKPWRTLPLRERGERSRLGGRGGTGGAGQAAWLRASGCAADGRAGPRGRFGRRPGGDGQRLHHGRLRGQGWASRMGTPSRCSATTRRRCGYASTASMPRKAGSPLGPGRSSPRRIWTMARRERVKLLIPGGRERSREFWLGGVCFPGGRGSWTPVASPCCGRRLGPGRPRSTAGAVASWSN